MTSPNKDTETGGSGFVTTQITAATDGTAKLRSRGNRRSVCIRCLTGSAEAISYGETPAKAIVGMVLAAGESQVVDTTAAIYFFGTAGTGTITCVESYG